MRLQICIGRCDANIPIISRRGEEIRGERRGEESRKEERVGEGKGGEGRRTNSPRSGMGGAEGGIEKVEVRIIMG